MTATIIHGFKPIDTGTAGLVNENKLLEELVMRQVDRHAQEESLDAHWVANARTQLQQGFMALNRAVFQPTRIKPETPALEKFERHCEVLVEKLLRS